MNYATKRSSNIDLSLANDIYKLENGFLIGVPPFSLLGLFTMAFRKCIFYDGDIGKCGLSSARPKEKDTELCKLVYPVSSHGCSLRIDLETITELDLVLNRGRICDHKDDDTICPKHRFSLGIYWKPGKSCRHTAHPTGKKAAGCRSGSVALCRTLGGV